MYRAQLFGEQRLIEEQLEKTQRGCMAAVDAMITAVHQGRHGRGEFRIAADKLNDALAFEKNIYDSDVFPCPTNIRTC